MLLTRWFGQSHNEPGFESDYISYFVQEHEILTTLNGNGGVEVGILFLTSLVPRIFGYCLNNFTTSLC